MLVESVIFQTVPVPVIITVLAPRLSARILVLLELKLPVDNTNPFKFNVPSVSVQMPAAVHSVVFPDNDKVISALLIVVLKDTAVAVHVTVVAVPELASKVTMSTLVGSKRVATPPDVTANCVFPVPLQVPVPPTQKYEAMIIPQQSRQL
jgi:hypothetical protein